VDVVACQSNKGDALDSEEEVAVGPDLFLSSVLAEKRETDFES